MLLTPSYPNVQQSSSTTYLLQEKVIFFPNRKENTNEQKEGIQQLDNVINEEKQGLLLSGLYNRPAIYPAILNGLSKNYFETLKNKKAIDEITNNFTVIKKVRFFVFP